jgi:uncharacterized protein
MRNPRWLSSLLLLAATLPSCAEKVASLPAPTGYIDDYAAVLSAPAKSDMEALCRELHDKTKAQVFVVTIKTLEGESVESFGNELFRKWKIGEKKTDRGVLILFAINDHKDRIEVGYGLEGILNDAKTGDIGRDMVPELKASDYDSALKTGLNEVSQIIATDAGVKLDALADTTTDNEQAPPPPVMEPLSSENPTGDKIVFALPFIFAFSFFGWIIWLVRKNIRNGHATWGSASSGGSSFSSSDSSSSDSSSSSDDSFSGGDGGDSGGGGSSGSW